MIGRPTKHLQAASKRFPELLCIQELLHLQNGPKLPFWNIWKTFGRDEFGTTRPTFLIFLSLIVLGLTKHSPALQLQTPLYNMSDPQPQLRLQDMAVSDPANVTTDPAVPSYPVNPAGAYQYVGRVLLNRPPATQRNFYNVLEQNGLKDDILALEEISEDSVRALSFVDPDSNQQKNILAPDLAKLLIWKAYIHYRANDGKPLRTSRNIFGITPEEFGDWRFSHLHSTNPTSTTLSPSSSTKRTSPVSRPAYTPTDVFKRGIKRDPSLFPVMKQDSQFVIISGVL